MAKIEMLRCRLVPMMADPDLVYGGSAWWQALGDVERQRWRAMLTGEGDLPGYFLVAPPEL